jgi:antirestriction protein ArdC
MATVYEIVTERIIKMVEEKGHLPWQRPWKRNKAFPCNIDRPKESYKGINFWILLCQDYKSPYWLTFNQIKKGKGWIKKGEKGTYIVFWKFLEGKEKDGSPNGKRIPFLRYYLVWNLEQLDRYEGKIPEADTKTAPLDFSPIDACEMVLDEMPQSRNMIKHGKNRAAYFPFSDHIEIPNKEDFNSVEEYYSTLFHELAHSTGHESRVNRKDAFGGGFGREKYSKEELVAEISTCFLCHMVGIADKTVDNSAAYLGAWLKKLKNDPKLLITAASAAQKATDYILDA